MLQDYMLKESRITGMNFDFDCALDGLRGIIPNFDFSRFTRKDTVHYKAQHVFGSALFSESVWDMKVKFDMITRQKAVFGCLQVACAQDFLLVIHIDGLDQHMSPVKYCTIIRYCPMIPLFPR